MIANVMIQGVDRLRTARPILPVALAKEKSRCRTDF